MPKRSINHSLNLITLQVHCNVIETSIYRISFDRMPESDPGSDSDLDTAEMMSASHVYTRCPHGRSRGLSSSTCGRRRDHISVRNDTPLTLEGGLSHPPHNLLLDELYTPHTISY